MFEIDFLKAGEKKDADAICMRFDRPDGGGRAVAVLDAGWQDDGEFVVDFVKKRYGGPAVDLAIVSHPDGDHIGGMGRVVRDLDVAELLIHRLDQRGGAELDAGGAVADLVRVAGEQGTAIAEPFQSGTYLGGALTVLGPSPEYYAELLGEQKIREAEKKEPTAKSAILAALAESTRRLADRVLATLPVEEVLFGEGPGPGARNNSSTVILFSVGDFRALLTGDAGVPAIGAALDYAAAEQIDALAPDLIQIPHHGSRRNASSDLLDRVLGPIGGSGVGNAYASVCGEEDPKHPAGRVVNAYARRGYTWNWTAGNSIRRSSPDAPPRADYGPLTPMPAFEELSDEE
jgi:beta-lactamase superfamily II metal-dependent hydrolase